MKNFSSERERVIDAIGIARVSLGLDKKTYTYMLQEYLGVTNLSWANDEKLAGLWDILKWAKAREVYGLPWRKFI